MAVKAKQLPPKKPLKAKAPEPEEELDETEDEDSEDEEETGEEEQTAKGDGKAKKKGPPKKVVKDLTVRLLVESGDKKYGGAQVQGILKCLEENENEMKMSELIAALPDFIQTKQTPARIFGFYQRQLVNAGAIEVV